MLAPMMGRGVTRVGVRAVLALLVWVASVAGVAAAPPVFRDAAGVHVETVTALGARQLDVLVSTAALDQAVDVRILLPAGYEAETRAYPVLYLFHGTSGRAADWVTLGDAEASSAGLPLIVVMPDCGYDGDGGGWFADWFNGGAFGTPMWETFHIRQLIPWIDANLRTVATDTGRAVAGLSQGGFGALSYAARHPDLFTSVAAFSGACEIDRDPEAIASSTTIIQITTAVFSGKDPNAIFGPREQYPLNWSAHDPATLVTNLRGKDVHLWTGDGAQGPLDPGPPTAPLDQIEIVTFGATRLFHGHLEAARIPHTYAYYGAGTHSWPYWARDLREYLPLLMARFAAPPPPPRTISYLSADDVWEHYGWRVALQRAVRGYGALRHASRLGFALTGTGTATVTTPPFFAPGARVRVRMRGRGIRSASDRRADAAGRLQLAVPLSDGAASHTTRVSILRSR